MSKTFGSLLMAMENSDGDLTYAGRVGTGFSEADLTEMRRRHPTWRTLKKTKAAHEISVQSAHGSSA